jgi:predicted nucleic acid-binding protein
LGLEYRSGDRISWLNRQLDKLAIAQLTLNELLCGTNSTDSYQRILVLGCDDRMNAMGGEEWNPIEHRLFSFISLNWAGIPH